MDCKQKLKHVNANTLLPILHSMTVPWLLSEQTGQERPWGVSRSCVWRPM